VRATQVTVEYAKLKLTGSPDSGKHRFQRRKPMGSHKETDGFHVGIHWLPSANTMITNKETN